MYRHSHLPTHDGSNTIPFARIASSMMLLTTISPASYTDKSYTKTTGTNDLVDMFLSPNLYADRYEIGWYLKYIHETPNQDACYKAYFDDVFLMLKAMNTDGSPEKVLWFLMLSYHQLLTKIFQPAFRSKWFLDLNRHYRVVRQRLSELGLGPLSCQFNQGKLDVFRVIEDAIVRNMSSFRLLMGNRGTLTSDEGTREFLDQYGEFYRIEVAENSDLRYAQNFSDLFFNSNGIIIPFQERNEVEFPELVNSAALFEFLECIAEPFYHPHPDSHHVFDVSSAVPFLLICGGKIGRSFPMVKPPPTVPKWISSFKGLLKRN